MRKVFAIKGRPSTNPVIVHVADAAVAKRFALSWPDNATKLVEKFWPGPLTIIVPKAESIVTAATAGRKTVALRRRSGSSDDPGAASCLRRPDHRPAQPILRVSPTLAQHVRDELGKKIDLVLDGGPCKVGIESTVLDLSVSPPTLLRPEQS